MPIKPENKHRYPDDWSAIRAAILQRAGHCCEWCKKPNRQMVGVDRAGNWSTETAWYDTKGVLMPDRVFDPTAADDEAPWGPTRVIKVILTIAHLDHTPEHNDAGNLRALCQRCHLNYDKDHHAATARATRDARSGQLRMGL